MTLILHQGPTIPFLYSHIGTSHLNTHVLSSGSTHYSVRNERKCKTSPDLTMLKKVRNEFLDLCLFVDTHLKLLGSILARAVLGILSFLE